MKSNIKAILFDLGGVLYQIDYARMESAFRALNPHLEVSIFSPDSQVEITFLYERGEISTDTFLRQLQRYFPDATPQQLADAWNSLLVGLYSHSVPLLESLSNQVPLFLLSNINELHYQRAYEAIERIKPYFEECFFSFLIGHRKPERSAFAYVLNRIGMSPEAILFLDDSWKNVQVAQEMGFSAVQVQGETLMSFELGKDITIGEFVSLL